MNIPVKTFGQKVSSVKNGIVRAAGQALSYPSRTHYGTLEGLDNMRADNLRLNREKRQARRERGY